VRVNERGGEEFEALKQLDDIFNNAGTKRVTPTNVVPEPRVQVPPVVNPTPEPRVRIPPVVNLTPEPRVHIIPTEPQRLQERQKQVTFVEGTAIPEEDNIPLSRPAASAKPIRRQPIQKATIDKPIQKILQTDRTSSINAPVLRSKYSQALLDIVKRRRTSPRRPIRYGCELAQAVLDGRQVCATECAHEIFDEESGKLLKYRQLITHPKYKQVWMHSSANEFGRLAQGVGGRIKGTSTIFFIHKNQVPNDRWNDVTYVKFVCELKPNKAEKHRTRLTVGGDKVHYPGDVGTPTADLTLVKTHVNSVVSTRGARYMTLDISNFYLNTPMVRYEYVRIKIDDIPDEIIEEYN